MTTTIIEVIDTAVKVGLGALISGLASYWVSRSKSINEANKEIQTRQRQLLESSAEQIEEFSHVLMKYWALIIENVRNKNQGMSLAEHRKEDLKKTKAELFLVFKQLTSAESKLLLLGHSKPQKLLREYGELAREFRRSAWEGNNELTEDLMEKYRSDLHDSRNNLFLELSKAYKSKT